jgi:hypothetical protein
MSDRDRPFGLLTDDEALAIAKAASREILAEVLIILGVDISDAASLKEWHGNRVWLTEARKAEAAARERALERRSARPDGIFLALLGACGASLAGWLLGFIHLGAKGPPPAP